MAATPDDDAAGGAIGSSTSRDGDGVATPSPADAPFGAAQPSVPPLWWNGGKWWKLRDTSSDAAAAAPSGGMSPQERAFRLMVAGGEAGAIAKTCVAPLERVKMQLQVHGMRHPGEVSPGIYGTLRGIIAREGIPGLWVGNWANVVRIIPNKGVLFMSNDAIRRAMMSDGQKQLSPWGNLVAGSLAGGFVCLSTYPLDLIRSKLMAQETKGEYKGIVDCGMQSLKEGGVRGMYRGLLVSLAGIMPYAGVNFASYDVFKNAIPSTMRDKDGTPFVAAKLACGAAAGTASQTVTFPLDVIRRRLQLQGSHGMPAVYANSFDCAKQIVAKEGARGLFRGCLANVLRAGPNVAVQFAAYDYLKVWLKVA